MAVPIAAEALVAKLQLKTKTLVASKTMIGSVAAVAAAGVLVSTTSLFCSRAARFE